MTKEMKKRNARANECHHTTMEVGIINGKGGKKEKFNIVAKM